MLLPFLVNSWRCQIGGLYGAERCVVDVRDGLASQLPDQTIVVVQEICLVVVVKSFLEIEHDMVGETE